MKKSLMLLLVASFVLGIAGTALAFPVDFSGDVRYQFRSWDDTVGGVSPAGVLGKYNDQLGRLRLNFTGQIDQNVTLYGRFATRTFFGNQTVATDNNNVFDQYGVKINSNGWTYNVGRQAISLGQGTIINTGSDAGYDSKFDGVVASGKMGVVNSTFAVGKSTNSLLTGFIMPNGYAANWWGADFSAPVTDNLSLGVTAASEKIQEPGQTANKYMGVNATYNPTSNLSFNTEYVKSNANADNKAYFIGGTYSMDKDSFTVQYNNVQKNSVDQALSGIGNLMYPFNGNNLGATATDKYSGFTYVYNHQMSKAAAFNVCYMSLKGDNETGSDNEYAAGVQWSF